MTQNKEYTAEFKFKAVMESDQRDTTIEEVCRKFGLAYFAAHTDLRLRLPKRATIHQRAVTTRCRSRCSTAELVQRQDNTWIHHGQQALVIRESDVDGTDPDNQQNTSRKNATPARHITMAYENFQSKFFLHFSVTILWKQTHMAVSSVTLLGYLIEVGPNTLIELNSFSLLERSANSRPQSYSARNHQPN